jgi:hypothetical protein
VVPDGGPTLICPKALPRVLQWLYDHPEGGYSNQVLLDCMKDIDEKDFVYVSEPTPTFDRSRRFKACRDVVRRGETW